MRQYQVFQLADLPDDHSLGFLGFAVVDGHVIKARERNAVHHQRGAEAHGVQDGAAQLLGMLREAGGRLPLGDDSSPEEIHRRTQLSKKAFKRSLGVLLKRGIVAADAEGIKLTKQ